MLPELLRSGRPRMSCHSQILLSQPKSAASLAPNIAGSLQSAASLNHTSPQNPDECDERGSEIRPSVMFDGCENVFVALVARRLREDGLDPHACLNGTVRARIDRCTAALLAHTHDTSELERVMLREAEAR